MLHPLLLTPLAVAALVAAEARAGAVEDAEHVRLTEEMRRLSKRNAWKGVEASYRELEELERKGMALTYEDHWLGAQAARATGDITAVHERLEKAAKVQGTEEVIAWLSDLDATYGAVDLQSRRKAPVGLAATQIPFAPDQRAAIEAAVAEVAASGSYKGLLPAGEYTFGGEPVSVKAGQTTPTVALVDVKAPRESTQTAFLGPRLTVGPAWTSAGDPAEVSWEADSFQPSGWGGLGGRVGVGVEAGLGSRVGVLAEVGWHGGFGARLSSEDTAGISTVLGEPYDVRGASLHAGYGFLGLVWRFGDTWLDAGPLWSVGRAYTSEVVDDEAACGDCVVAARGTIMAPGAMAGVSRAFARIGSLQGAVTLNVGGQHDGSRLYTWGQVAFTLAPGSRRSTR